MRKSDNKIQNNAPLVIGEYPNQMSLSRKFLGDLFPKNCYEKKELQAYLKGQTHFSYKKDLYPVRQEYFYQ